MYALKRAPNAHAPWLSFTLLKQQLCDHSKCSVHRECILFVCQTPFGLVSVFYDLAVSASMSSVASVATFSLQ